MRKILKYIGDEEIRERFQLSTQRIKEIVSENIIEEPYGEYFRSLAKFLIEGSYEDMKKETYDKCYANPAYSVNLFGEEMGRLLSFLYFEAFNVLPFYAREEASDIVIINEVFLELYSEFTAQAEEGGEKKIPDHETVKEILYNYVFDYLDFTVYERLKQQIDPKWDFAKKIITESDLNDTSYLYKFGEYVDEDIIKTAEFLNSLPEEDIKLCADTFTEGYRKGFEMSGKDIKKKKTVSIRYTLGFERIVKKEIENFKAMGLECTIYPKAQHASVRGAAKVGYYGALVNEQMDYDHREDCALFIDRAYVERKLEVLKNSYEKLKEKAYVFGGPAVMERFGEEEFVPVNKPEAFTLSSEQRKLQVELASRSAVIANEYIKREERSYTIISYPVPAIGKDFEEIFKETVRINTLPYEDYLRMQQAVIEELEKGTHVEVKGKNGNRTDIRVSLHKIEDPEKQSVFENCVADVNIPVGEVFTSPVLKGTTGTLHVSQVYLEGYMFRDLELRFEDGFVKEYSCANFKITEENRKYIEDNILFHHETLPIGEFAIGTDTAAYAMAKKFDIFGKLPILIAEKTGPHFAVGDTCYSRQEDVKVFNPDGKEIISRENEHTEKYRKEDPLKAYFNCHTDITIPYEELEEICSVDDEGNRFYIIKDGRFVVEGAEELNKPLMDLT